MRMLQVDRVIMIIKVTAKSLWADSEVEIFGSRKTGVALSSSNLDVVIRSPHKIFG